MAINDLKSRKKEVVVYENYGFYDGMCEGIVYTGNHEYCPECGSNKLMLVTDINVEPKGYRIGCHECGFEIPESEADTYTVYGYFAEEEVKRAIEAWDHYCININNQEEVDEVSLISADAEGEIQYFEDGSFIEVLGGRRLMHRNGLIYDIDVGVSASDTIGGIPVVGDIEEPEEPEV